MWVRLLVKQLTKVPGITVVLAGRDAPDWQNAHPFHKKQNIFRSFSLSYFSDKEAGDFLAQKEITNPAYKRYFKQWAAVNRNRYSPLLLNICCDIVLYAQSNNHKIDAEEFRIMPASEDEKLYALVKKFFQTIDRELGLAIIALNACQTVDPARFLLMGKAFYFDALESMYRQISAFAIAEPECAGKNIQFRFHKSIARNISKYGNKIVRAAHQHLLEYFQKEEARGVETATAAMIYHANCLRWEQGVLEWIREFDQALSENRYNFIRLLFSLSGKLHVDSDYWQARIAQAKGDYYAKTNDCNLATAFYNDALATLDTFLATNERDADAVIAKVVVLQRLTQIHARENQHDKAAECYNTAIQGCDALLEQSPNELTVICKKADLQTSFGRYFLSQNKPEDTNQQLTNALATTGEALSRAPEHAGALLQKAIVLAELGALYQYSGKNEAAISHFNDAILLFNEAIRHGEEKAET
ncbi:MAG: hypothetical protein ACE5I1_29500, partial [bacterium]